MTNEQQFEWLRQRIDSQQQQIDWLRNRLAVLLPERSYCPYCKALVSEHSVACQACGKSWGKTEDPKKGIPR